MNKVIFKTLIYNPRTDQLGLPVLVSNMLLVYVGEFNTYRVFTNEWQEVGFI